MSDKYLLNLEEIHDRPLIKVFGEAYELRIQEDFNVVDLAWFQVLGKEIKAQGQQKDPAAAKRLDELLSMAVDKIVINLPEAVNKKLGDMQKIQIVQVFIKAVMPEAVKAETAKQKTGVKSTTGRPSQSCSDSMEEPPKVG